MTTFLHLLGLGMMIVGGCTIAVVVVYALALYAMSKDSPKWPK